MSKEPAAKRQPFLGEIGLFFCQPVGSLLGSQRKLENLGNRGKIWSSQPHKGKFPAAPLGQGNGELHCTRGSCSRNPVFGWELPFLSKMSASPVSVLNHQQAVLGNVRTQTLGITEGGEKKRLQLRAPLHPTLPRLLLTSCQEDDDNLGVLLTFSRGVTDRMQNKTLNITAWLQDSSKCIFFPLQTRCQSGPKRYTIAKLL